MQSHYIEGTWTTDGGETLTGRYATMIGLGAELGLKEAAIRRHIHAGHIRHHRVGSRYLIPVSEVTRLKREYRPNMPWRVVTKARSKYRTGTFTTDDGQEISGAFATLSDLADELELSYVMIKHHLYAGHIRHYRVDGRYLVPDSEVRRIKREYRPHKPWRRVVPKRS